MTSGPDFSVYPAWLNNVLSKLNNVLMDWISLTFGKYPLIQGAQLYRSLHNASLTICSLPSKNCTAEGSIGQSNATQSLISFLQQVLTALWARVLRFCLSSWGIGGSRWQSPPTSAAGTRWSLLSRMMTWWRPPKRYSLCTFVATGAGK